MMEDYEDLFSDPLPLPPPPLARGLQERLDELRSVGCCRKIAWSKMGCIAYISTDGKELHLATLLHHKKKGIWDLHLHTDPTLVDHIMRTFKGRELAHLSWNPSGSELLVADIYGRLAICTIVIAMNRLTVSKTWNDPDNYMNSLVGLFWLNVKKVVPLYRSAVRQDGQWNYAVTQQETKGPYNPWATKSPLSAMVIVSRGGSVRLVYQGPDNSWHDVRHEIDDFATTNELLTHAALCPDRGDSLLLAVHTTGKQLRLYRATIDWQQPAGKEPASSEPKISFQHLETIDDCCPMLDYTTQNQETYTLPSSEAQLSHIELLAQAADPRSKESASPTILATFSYLPNQYSVSGVHELPYTILSRWVMRNVESTLHSVFGSLTSKKSSSPVRLKESAALVRLQDVRIDHVAIDIQQVLLSNAIAVAYSDGSVDLRDRFIMQSMATDEGMDKVTSLIQVGFGFQATDPCLHVALSPNTCVKAFFGHEHEPKMVNAQLVNRDIDIQHNIFTEKATAAFVLHNATAGFNNNNNDDLLLTMQDYMTHLPPDESLAQRNKMEQDFLRDLYRTLNVNLDQSTDPQSDKLLRYPMLQRCLSLQAALGNRSDKVPRSVISKVAWVMMNLRMIALTFAFAFAKSGSAPEGSSELSKPEIMQAMIGLARWSMTLTDYIVDQLFELKRCIEPDQGFEMNVIWERIRATRSPALLLLLTSTARTFLRYNCRGLRGLSTLSSTHLDQQHPHSHPSALLAPSHALSEIFASAHLPPRALESLFLETDSLVKHAYAAAQPTISEQRQQVLEREMLVSGEVPEVLWGVVERVLGKGGLLERVGEREGVSEGELFFGGFEELGLDEDLRTREWWARRTVDEVRKIVLRKKPTDGEEMGSGEWKGTLKLRTCLRCGAVMEDLLPSKGASGWVMSLQRTCFCGGFWMV
ncbi:mediator complex subunit [Xylographa opegraphella]|nr:mediator complex subunit [Xylographa opegraphella]